MCKLDLKGYNQKLQQQFNILTLKSPQLALADYTTLKFGQK